MKKLTLNILLLPAVMILTSCAEDPTACFTHEVSDTGDLKLNSSCSENVETNRWYITSSQFPSNSEPTKTSEERNPAFQLILPGESTVSLVIVNHYKQDSIAETIDVPEYCVICEDYNQCAGYFKVDAENRAAFLNGTDDFDSCVVEVKQ